MVQAVSSTGSNRGIFTQIPLEIEERIFFFVPFKDTVKINSYYKKLAIKHVVTENFIDIYELFSPIYPEVEKYSNFFKNVYESLLATLVFTEVQAFLTQPNMKVDEKYQIISCQAGEHNFSFIQRAVVLKRIIQIHAINAINDHAAQYKITTPQAKLQQIVENFYSLVLARHLGHENLKQQSTSHQSLTMLHYFSAMGHLIAVRYLIGVAQQLGLSIDLPSELGTPLNCACLAGDVFIAKLLKQHGAVPQYGLNAGANDYQTVQLAAVKKQDDKNAWHPNANDFTKRQVLEFLCASNFDLESLEELSLLYRSEIRGLLGLYLDEELLTISSRELSDDDFTKLLKQMDALIMSVDPQVSVNAETIGKYYSNYNALKTYLRIFKTADNDAGVFLTAYHMAGIAYAINKNKLEVIHTLRYSLAHFDYKTPISNSVRYTNAINAARLLTVCYVRFVQDASLPSDYLGHAKYYMSIAKGLAGRQYQYLQGLITQKTADANQEQMSLDLSKALADFDVMYKEIVKQEKKTTSPMLATAEQADQVIMPAEIASNRAYQYSQQDFPGLTDVRFFKNPKKRSLNDISHAADPEQSAAKEFKN